VAVAYFMSTELGREVQLEDWIGFHRDRLLSVLYQMKEMGVPNPGFEVSMIEGVTGLPRAYADQLARLLLSQGYLEGDGHMYRLTENGVRWVLESPGQ
jgi:DNA-binding IclR family transcriptional regulator